MQLTNVEMLQVLQLAPLIAESTSNVVGLQVKHGQPAVMQRLDRSEKPRIVQADIQVVDGQVEAPHTVFKVAVVLCCMLGTTAQHSMPGAVSWLSCCAVVGQQLLAGLCLAVLPAVFVVPRVRGVVGNTVELHQGFTDVQLTFMGAIPAHYARALLRADHNRWHRGVEGLQVQAKNLVRRMARCISFLVDGASAF
jgi:hypothetical protein